MSLVRVAGGFPVALEVGFRFRGHEVGGWDELTSGAI